MSRVHSRSARLAARAIASSPAVAGFRPAAAALAVAAVFALQPGVAHAQPSGAQVIHGQATFTRNGNDLLVTTANGPGSSHSAINWQSFSVPTGSITQFNQPSATSTSINRVVGPDPSAIFGTLRSNGRLVLVNPAGIAVGTGAVVDTAGFTASTLQMSEADAIAGRLRFFNDGTSGALTVEGTVRAQGGDVVLIAPDVQTAGPALVQSDGATVLAAGRKVEITGRGLEGIHMEVRAGDRAVNLGTLQGDAVGIFAGTLRHSGIIAARAVSGEGGKVVLKASGDNLVSGAIAATAVDGKGGSIDVLGQRVGLLAGAVLDASGAQGGGQVRVGGDYQGQNAAVPNAAQTHVDASATISADATQQGDGGRIIVWSDDATRMHGQVSARGGAQGGDGGFTEVSAKKSLEFTGRVDLRAPKGAAGTLLLDPEDVTIFHDTPSGTLRPASGNTSPPDLDLDPAHAVEAVIFAPSTAAPARLSDAQLNSQLAYSHVLVTTDSTSSTRDYGQIKLDADATIEWSSSSQLALRANKGIEILGTIHATDPQAKLHLLALNGDITEGPNGVIAVPSLFAWATGDTTAGGQILLPGKNLADRFAARADGGIAQVAFHNAKSLEIGDVTTVFAAPLGLGGANGIEGTNGTTRATVNVSAEGDLTANSGAQVSGGAVTLGATGNVEIAPRVVPAAPDVDRVAVASTGPTRVYGSTSLTIDAGTSILVGRQRSSTALPEVTGEDPGSTGLVTAGTIDIAAPQVTIASSTRLVASGQINVAADGLTLDGAMDNGASRTVLTSFGSARAIQLGGKDDGSALHLSQEELARIRTGTLAIGSGTATGGIRIDGDIALAEALQVTTKGRLRVAGNVSSAAQGNAVTLAADTLELADGGGIAAPNGRWLVYLAGPDNNRFSNASTTLASGNLALWNRTFGGQPPASIAETGNRYVFAFQPQVDITIAEATKVYDGTLAFRGLDVQVLGFVDPGKYGNVFLQDTASGTLAVPGLTKNVGTYTMAQGSFGVAGYAVRSFSGGPLTITPRALNVSLSAQDKVYDGTTAATVAFGDDRIAGDLLTIQGTGAFADKNAGTGKLVTTTLQPLGGADAGNYVLAQAAAVARADITPAALTIAARDALKPEGAALAFTGNEFTATGLVAGETIGSVTLTSAGADAAARADRYAINASAPVVGNGFLPSNYSTRFQDGLLTVLAPQSSPVAAQVNSQVIAFAQLFVQEAMRQAQQEADHKRIGQDDIVITDTACKP